MRTMLRTWYTTVSPNHTKRSISPFLHHEYVTSVSPTTKLFVSCSDLSIVWCQWGQPSLYSSLCIRCYSRKDCLQHMDEPAICKLSPSAYWSWMQPQRITSFCSRWGGGTAREWPSLKCMCAIRGTFMPFSSLAAFSVFVPLTFF